MTAIELMEQLEKEGFRPQGGSDKGSHYRRRSFTREEEKGRTTVVIYEIGRKDGLERS